MDSSSFVEPIAVQVDDQNVTLWRPAGVDQPQVKDVDLAVWLGMERPRDIRQLINRHLSSLTGISRYRTAKIGRGRPEEGFYLCEASALFICAKSETEKADDVLRYVIQVYLTWRDLGAMALPPDWRAQQEQRQREMSHTLELRRLDMEEQRLAFDRRQAQALALQTALQHPLLVGVGDDIRRAHLITSVELATGMSLPALRPSAAHIEGWLSPTEIARQTNSTPMAVGLAITRLWGKQRREVAGRSKSLISSSRPREGEPAKTVVVWVYSPPATEQIIAEMSGKSKGKARAEAAA